MFLEPRGTRQCHSHCLPSSSSETNCLPSSVLYIAPKLISTAVQCFPSLLISMHKEPSHTSLPEDERDKFPLCPNLWHPLLQHYSPPCRFTPTSCSTIDARSAFCRAASYRSALNGIRSDLKPLARQSEPRLSVAMS